MTLVTIGSEGGISALHITRNSLQGHLPRQAICLFAPIRRRPIHRLLKSFHQFRRQLDLAVPCLAVLELFDVRLIESEAIEIGEPGGITELSNGEIAGKFAQ